MADHPLYSGCQIHNDHSIRVLTLSGVSQHHEGPLEGAIEVVSLDDHPEYAALSYTWGAPTFSHEIKCKVSAKSATEQPYFKLSITKTLHTVLIHLYNNGVQKIWVDQICINQGDHEDRSKQVALMRRIYTQAAETFLYVGELKAENEIYPETIEWLFNAKPIIERAMAEEKARKDRSSAESEEARNRYWAELDSNPSNFPDEQDGMVEEQIFKKPTLKSRLFRRYEEYQEYQAQKREEEIATPSEMAARGWFHLLQRPFFTRKWIIQEIVLSGNKKLLIGPHIYPWDTILGEVGQSEYGLNTEYSMITRYLDIEDINSVSARISLLQLIMLLRQDEKRKKEMTMLSLLKVTRFFDATDNRDIIFGLMGMADDASEFKKPDYGGSVESTFCDFTMQFIQRGRAYQVLPYAGITKDGSDMPTWAVDWQKFRESYRPESYRAFTADIGPESFIVGKDGRSLQTTGQFFGAVLAVSAQLKGSKEELIADYVSKCYDAFSSYFEDKDDELALYRAAFSFSKYTCKHNDDENSEITRRYSSSSGDSGIFEGRVGKLQLDKRRENTTIDRNVLHDNMWRMGTLMSMGWRATNRKIEERLSRKEGLAASLARKLNSSLKPKMKEPSEFLDTLFSGGIKESDGLPSLDDLEGTTPGGRAFVYSIMARSKLLFLGPKSIAIGPPLAEAGDEIFIIPGQRVPLLLRKASAGYRLVGPCYVSEIMYGEACNNEQYPRKEVVII